MARTVGILIFPGFELLDVFGPAEMLGLHLDEFELRMVAETGEPVASTQGPRSVPDDSFDAGRRYDVLLVPGGSGTRREKDNERLLSWLRDAAANAEFVTSVCTGSLLLARAGLLTGRRATTNKLAFDWVAEQCRGVDWVRKARWVRDGNLLTSSGVSAGMDMALALIAELLGEDAAADAARWAEYHRNADPEDDPFATGSP